MNSSRESVELSYGSKAISGSWRKNTCGVIYCFPCAWGLPRMVTRIMMFWDLYCHHYEIDVVNSQLQHKFKSKIQYYAIGPQMNQTFFKNRVQYMLSMVSTITVQSNRLLQSLTNVLFVKQLIQVHNKEISKFPRYCPLQGNTSVTCEGSTQRASDAESVSMLSGQSSWLQLRIAVYPNIDA